MADMPFRPVESGTQPVQPLRPVTREQKRKEPPTGKNPSGHPRKEDQPGHQLDEFA